MSSNSIFNEIENALIGDILEKYLKRTVLPEDHQNCDINDFDPYNKILFYKREKLGVIKYVIPIDGNIEYGLKFIPVEGWLK